MKWLYYLFLLVFTMILSEPSWFYGIFSFIKKIYILMISLYPAHNPTKLIH